MQIKTTQTTEKTEDITLPFFRKRIDPYTKSVKYFGVLPDSTSISIFQIKGATNVRHQKIDSLDRDDTEAYLLRDDWRICEEEDFLSFHMETLKSLSLEAVLVNAGKKDADDLKNVLEPIGPSLPNNIDDDTYQ